MSVVFTKVDLAGLFPYETLMLVSATSLSWTDQLPQRSSFSLLHGRYIPACQGLEAE